MELITVKISDEKNAVVALYINGNLYKYGDCNHDKFDEYLKGFVGGLKFILGIAVSHQMIEIHNYQPLIDKVLINGDSPPERLQDIDIIEN